MANELKVEGKLDLGNSSVVSMPRGASDPVSALNGDQYYNTVSNVVRVYQNGSWQNLIASSTGAIAASVVSYDHTTSGLAATTAQAAVDELDGRIDTNEANISTNTSKVGHLETLSGRPTGSDNLGTFTGTTIGDNETTKQALQDLETAIELRALDAAVIKKDGSVAYTGNQPMGTHKLTGLLAGSTAGDSVRYEQAILATGVNPWSANQDLGGHKITGSADPSSAQDVATKAYVDAVAVGLSPKKAVIVASTGSNLVLAGEQTVDGILTSASRILVKDQTLPAQNGIYVTAVGAWTRATDFDSVSPIDEINGAWVPVELGTVNAGRVYIQYGTVVTLGTDPITFEFYNPIASLIGGDMVTVSGSTISVDLATVSGLESSNPGNAAGQLRVKLEASNPSLQIDGSNQLGTKLSGSGAIVSGASGLAVQLEASNPSLQISSDRLGAKLDPAGALASGSAGIATQVDGSTLEINTNALRLKDAGTTNAKLGVMTNNTVKANKSGITASPTDLALSDVVETGSSIFTISSGTKSVISASNLTIKANLASAHLYVGNVSNVPTDVAVGGDLTLDNTGAFTVAKIQGVTVSGTTGTGNSVFSSGPTITNPIVGTQTASDSSTKAASTAFVATAITNALAAFQPLEATYAASTANVVGTYLNGVSGVGATFTVTATGAFTIDGVSPPSGSRILFKDQTSGFQNGVYDLTTVGSVGVSPILTRSLDFNTASDMNAGDLIPVINGTVNTVTSWLQTASITTVGTDSLVFTQYSKNPATNNFLAKSTGDIDQTSFSAANNQSSATNVTGLAFANGSVRSAEVLYSIALSATSSKFEVGKLLLVQRGSDWQLSQQYGGDNAGFVFTVTSAGQVQYTSPNSAGFSSATIKFRAIVTNV